MINQPDTTTMEGRHAVERASLKFRIQRLPRKFLNQQPCYDVFIMPDGFFDWERNNYCIHHDDLQAWAEAQKRDVWTIDERVFLECNGMAKAPLSGIPRSVRNEILAALNGAPAADGMVINPDRYWYERSREADAEITELKRQLADKDAETEAASGRRHENP
jgi:hypothetical protein